MSVSQSWEVRGMEAPAALTVGGEICEGPCSLRHDGSIIPPNYEHKLKTLLFSAHLPVCVCVCVSARACVGG